MTTISYLPNEFYLLARFHENLRGFIEGIDGSLDPVEVMPGEVVSDLSRSRGEEGRRSNEHGPSLLRLDGLDGDVVLGTENLPSRSTQSMLVC